MSTNITLNGLIYYRCTDYMLSILCSGVIFHGRNFKAKYSLTSNSWSAKSD